MNRATRRQQIRSKRKQRKVVCIACKRTADPISVLDPITGKVWFKQPLTKDYMRCRYCGGALQRKVTKRW